MSFHPGQLVICVDDRHDAPDYVVPAGANMPCRGVVYTVRDAVWWPPECIDVVWLAELDNRHLGPRACFDQGGFNAKRFRPIAEDRLAIFRQHLAPVPSKESEPA